MANVRVRLSGITEGILVLGFCTLFLCITLTSISAYRNGTAIIDNSGLVRHTMRVLLVTQETDTAMNAADAAMRAYFITGSAEQISTFEDELKTVRASVQRLRSLTQDNRSQLRRLAELEGLIAQRATRMRHLIGVHQAGGLEAVKAEANDETRRIRAEIYATLADIKNEEMRLMDLREKRAEHSVRAAHVSFWTGTTVAMGALFGFFVMMRNNLEARERLRVQDARSKAELEQKVRERTEELTNANRDLESFSYSVSHDLRAPLRAIGAFAYMVGEDAEERLTAAEKENLQRVSAGVSRMSNIIDSLLRLSRVAQDKLDKEPVDLSEIATDSAADAQMAIPGNHSIVIEPGLTATADRRLMRVLFNNLIGNALKFSSKVESPVVTVGKTTIDNEPVFFVKDNGAGFEQEYAGGIFEPFKRLHTEEEFTGTGVGLATCENIVRRHGGTIWAEGEPGKGATFFFTLPTNGH